MKRYKSGFDVPIIGTIHPKGSVVKRNPDGTISVIIPQTFAEIKKYNPYHGSDGRFTGAGGAKSTVPNSKISFIPDRRILSTDAPPASKPASTFIRKDPPPKKTLKAYKVFYAKDGKLYPPMVANPGGQDTPVGVWLDAQEGTRAADSKTGRKQVKAGGKGTQGGSGTLAYRPGWHLGEFPEAKQFARVNPENGKKELFPKDFVWAECEIAADRNYQEKAMSYGYNKNGKFQHSLAGLPELPKDGYYKYRTNPNPDTAEWFITGAMKVNRILNDKETDKLLRDRGITPPKRQGGRIDDVTKLGFTSDGQIAKSERKEKMAKMFEDIKALFEKPKEIEKFNPYHDALGRFTSGNAATSFTYRPGASKAHNRSIAREVVRTGKYGNNKRMVGTRVDETASGTNVYQPKNKGGRLIGNAVRQYNRSERQSNSGYTESARERKNRLDRERNASGKSNTTLGRTNGKDKVAAQNRKGNPVYRMLQGNKRPKKAS